MVVAVRIGRACTARGFHNGVKRPGRQDNCVGARRAEVVDNLLDSSNRARGGKNGFLLHADDARDEHVPLPVGALGVHDCHVRTQRRYRREQLACEGTLYGPDAWVHAWKVGS